MPFLPAGVGAAVAAGAAGAAVSAGAGLLVSSMQGGATKDAQTSANATQTAADDKATAALAPYNTAGQNALLTTADLSGANGPDAATKAMGGFTASPGYQYQLTQGLRAVDAGAAAKGMLRSGSTLKAEQDRGSQLANQDFTNYYNRLFGLSQLGENAGAKTGDQAITTGQGIAGTDVGSGAAETSIYGNAGKGVSNALTTGLNNYNSNSPYSSRTNALLPDSGTDPLAATSSTFSIGP